MENMNKDKIKGFVNKYKKLIIGIGVFLVVSLFTIIIFLLFDDSHVEEKTISSRDLKIMKEYVSLIEDSTKNFYDEYSYYLDYKDINERTNYEYDVYCSDGYINYDGSIYLNKCSIDGKDVYYTYGTKKKENNNTGNDELDSNKYVYEKNGSATMSVPEDDTGYEKYEIKIDGSMYELLSNFGSYLFYVDHNYSGQIINYKTGEKLLSSVVYDAIYPIYLSDSKKYDTNYIIVRIKDRWSIYNINSASQVGTDYETFDVYGRETSVAPRTQFETLVANNLIVKNNNKCGVIDYVTGRVVVPIDYNNIYIENNYLVVDNDIYDFYGNSIFNNTYNKVYGISEMLYIFVNDNGNYKIVDINKNVKYDFGKVDSDSEIVLRNSYVGDETVVFSCYAKKDKKDYIYHFEYNFVNNTGKIRTIDN